MSEIADVIIIGGGVVGTAIAAELAPKYKNVFVLEALPRLGLGASTRNSGVIHGGMYYRPQSLKAFHCIRGARLLYEFCQTFQVPHQRIGKFIVAASLTEAAELEALKVRGEENGVEGLTIVTAADLKRAEPNVAAPLALFSPHTGIIDAEYYLKTLARLAIERGAQLVTNTRVTEIMPRADGGFAVRTSQGEMIQTRFIVNAAGLFADEVAQMVGHTTHTIYPCRGEYAELSARLSHIVRHLIYPLPPATGHGLGIHFTKSLNGTVYLGPNAIYVTDKNNYENERAALETFFTAAQSIVPCIQRDDLRLSYTGIRARLLPEHDHQFADFWIAADETYPQMIQLIGIESPGLTASLSIAQSVRALLRDRS